MEEVGAYERALGLPDTPAGDLRSWAAARGCPFAAAATAIDLEKFAEAELRVVRLRAAKRFRAAKPRQALLLWRAEALCAELELDGLELDEHEATVESLLGAAAGFLTAHPERLAAMRSFDERIVPIESPRLQAIDGALRGDFALRRAMLLKRCDVSVQSFLWGEAAQGNESAIVSAISSRRDALGADPPGFTCRDAVAASSQRTAAIAERLSGPESIKQPKSVAKGVLIGSVPNRGGRVDQTTRAAAMPAWQPRTALGSADGRQRKSRR